VCSRDSSALAELLVFTRCNRIDRDGCHSIALARFGVQKRKGKLLVIANTKYNLACDMTVSRVGWHAPFSTQSTTKTKLKISIYSRLLLFGCRDWYSSDRLPEFQSTTGTGMLSINKSVRLSYKVAADHVLGRVCFFCKQDIS